MDQDRVDPQNQGDDTAGRAGDRHPFPIVGIGASAGGLEAIQKFFTSAPPDSGMGFVVVQHMDPTHESMLSELVGKNTRMPVTQVADGQIVKPNHVYIIPPNYDMAIMHGKLHLMAPNAPRGLRLPIDLFFKSMAEDQGERSICVVLSGTGTDGSLGLKLVKAQGGMCVAQDPATAKYDGMPKSAIATGLVDFVLAPEAMPESIMDYARKAFVKDPKENRISPSDADDDLQKVFMLLRSQTGHDFSYYKKNTIVRRIERRMTLHQVSSLKEYVSYLRENPLELETLFKELLIGVTNFFRDPEAFESLREKGIRPLVRDARADKPIRVWIPGCSTGEEAYTVAILFCEEMEHAGKDVKLQIFGTDIDTDAIDTARRATYPDNIAGDVPENYLKSHFEREDGSFLLNKRIRSAIVFAPQNVIDDPPFSQVNLIVCRNLLIYMGPQLQRKLIPLFHYSLVSGGFLFLGTSESIGEFDKLFETKDKKWRLFKKIDSGEHQGPRVNPNFPPFYGPRLESDATKYDQEPPKTNYKDVIQDTLMTNFSPSAVLVNRSCDILYISGGIEDFLIPPTGVPKFNLLSMARPNIKMELTSCVRKAYSENKHCKYEKLKLKAKDSENTVTIHAIPVSAPASMKGLMVVAFESTGKRPVKQGPGVDLIVHPEDLGDRKRAEQLEHELSSTKEYLKTTIEELETSNEELKSTNEELQSSNEELQSTNEELQTSKEELQSMNEELTTVNTELENKIEELSKANDDVNNLMSSSKVGVAFFDSDLNLKRYTPAVTNIINVLPSDLGRPLSHLTTNIQYDNLLKDVEDTARTLEDKEIETKADDGSWYLVRIAPYKTTYKSFEGVVVTFVDCTEQKRAEIELSEHRERLELTLWGADLALWDVYINSGEVHFNSQWAEMLGYGADELTPEIQTWRKLVHEDDISTVIKDWNAHLNGETPLFETKYRLKTKSGAYKWIMARGKVSQWDQEGKALRATGVFLDLSAPKAAEDAQMRTISDIEQKTEVLKEALSISPDHFHLYDLYGRCLYANESALTSLDLTSDQLVGKTVWDLSSKIDVLKDFDKRLEEILSTGDDIEGETYYRNTEGVSRFLYVFKPIRDRENNIVSVLAAYRKT